MTNRITIDLETTGSVPGCGIVAIGAVAHHRDGWITDRFYTIVSRASCIEAGLHESAETLEWWGKQSEQARQVLTLADDAEAPMLTEALMALNAFVARQHQPEVYGNGSDFDNAILAAAAHAVGVKLAWPFWMNRCYRTLKTRATVKIERHGVYHNALDDAVSQAHHLGEIERELTWDSARIRAAQQFIDWIAERLRRQTSRRVLGFLVPTMSAEAARDHARATFDALVYEAAAFGTPGHDWDRTAAHDAADEEMRNWAD